MLDSVEFKAYISRTIALARTIVIKSEDLAIKDNALMLKEMGIPIPDNKAQWRYYMNLNGEYHSTDTMMEVVSLDNSELINFTKANLDIHPATKRAYREGSYHYTRLTDKYPGQRDLINGIINPIPQSESIPAKNYQILRYNKDYVLWNEYQLIPALQAHVDNQVISSFNTEYVYTDNLMLAILLGNLHASLIQAILQTRMDAIGTRYAHEFHIWSRLTSLGLSSVYKPVLDRKQTMWLYRNMTYVLRLQGRRKTFDELVDIVLTHRRVPLERYEVLQTTEEQLDKLQPNARFMSSPVNMRETRSIADRLWTVEDVIRKERSLALDNEVNRPVDEEITDYSIVSGMTSQIPTKVLESVMTDTTDLNPHSIMKVLHNQWIYLAFKGLYVINHDFTDLRTGRNFRLNTKEAYILWAYLVNRYKKVPMGDIPEYDYYFARKITPPTYQELMSLGREDVLSEELTKDILKVDVIFPRLVSPDSFFTKSKEVFDKIWEHRKLYCRVMNMDWRMQTENACNALYETGVAKLTDIKTYSLFLKALDLSFEDYGEEELLDLAWAIWRKVTGWESVNYLSIAEQQRSLIRLMTDLTSYTVQYIGSVGDQDGHYEVGCELLVDTDVWRNDGETALVNDNEDQWFLDVNKATMDASLVIETRPLSVEGNFVSEMESTLGADIDLLWGQHLCLIENEPQVHPIMILGGNKVTMDPYD